MLLVTHRCFAAAAVTLLGVLFPVAANAQLEQSAAGTVAGAGSANVEKKPTLVRMTIQLQEKGASVEEALQKLADRLAAAELQLQSLGAKKSAIAASEPTLAGESDQEKQMRQLLMQQMRARGRVPRGLQMSKSVAVTSTVTCEWPLAMNGTKELLIFVSTLQDKVRAADLAGLTEPKQLSAEEAEMQEEMADMMGGYGGEQPKPGEPSFLYVAEISDEERSEAMAAAFGKAKAQAGRLASAAGAGLGLLLSLNGSTGQAGEDFDMYDYAMQAAWGQTARPAASENEATVAVPGMVTFRVNVNATFQLK